MNSSTRKGIEAAAKIKKVIVKGGGLGGLIIVGAAALKYRKELAEKAKKIREKVTNKKVGIKDLSKKAGQALKNNVKSIKKNIKERSKKIK